MPAVMAPCQREEALTLAELLWMKWTTPAMNYPILQ